MQVSIDGYEVTSRLENLLAGSLFLAHHHASGAAAIVKTLNAVYPRKRDIKRLEREFRVLQTFKGVKGIFQVSRLSRHGNDAPAIVGETSGLPLSHYLADGVGRDWSVARILDLGIDLCDAIGAVHARGLVHKNIAPRNILLDVDRWTVELMNFEIATVLTNESQHRGISKRLEGSLAYISPEQTGRMNRGLDYRSDFYSLGAVLYQLLFGRTPFEADSTLEWIHAHISKLPPTPDATDGAKPKPIVDIILRLLAKSPDDRYQSSFGLREDLEECRRQLREHGRISDFELAQNDVSEVFQIPQALYGREAELRGVLGLFEQVAQGDTRICMISGYSGVGKSALVNELDKPIVRTRGYFLRGKFDQFGRATPYSAISAAFSGLIHELLTESRERLDFWRTEITQALGANAQALIDIIPDLEKIIGPQPPVPALPPTEAQNRLQIVFQNFVRLLARPERPLIIFLDDLQWSDAPTLNLLQKLAVTRDISNLLILGAYRSNEVAGGHALRLALDEISKVRDISEIELAPLDSDAVGQIVAGSLRTDVESAAPLSELLHRKTEGNPFFVNELLKSLLDDGLISFNRSTGRWVWDMELVRQARIGDSVVEFLIANLRKLPEETSDALRLGACIGNEFDLRKLSVVHEKPMAEVGRAMMSALRRNVILPLDDTYQYFDQADDGSAVDEPEVNPRFKFQHDRLQQAAYELIDDRDKPKVHLSIGRLIQREMAATGGDDQLITVVRHLNEGRALIGDSAEREELARLNLAAGELAQNASAYHAALQYLDVGRELLGDAAWETHYELARGLSQQYARTAYLNGLYDAADAEMDVALTKVRTPLEQAEILSMRTRHYSTLGRMEQSILAALQGLRLLGIDITRDLSDDDVAAEIEDIARNRAGREIAELIQADRMTDPEISVAVGLLMEIFPAAFLSGAGNLFHFLVAKSVNLSLQHGNSTETAFAYAAYGMLLCGALGDPRQGYEYGKLALAMNENFDDIGLKSRIIYVYGMFIHHWSNHWSTLSEWFRKGIEAGYQSGDLLYLAYNAQDCIIWDPTLDLETASREQRRYLDIVRDCEYQDSLDSGSLFLQLQLNFLGRTVGPFSLTDETFDEAECYARMRSRNFKTGVANYHIYKAEIHCLYGDHAGAAPHIEAQDALIESVMSLPQLTRFRFVSFISLAALFPSMPEAEKPAVRRRLEDNLAQMLLWAENCEANFRHLELAMAAELARLDADFVAAFQLYERAAAAARQSGFIRDEAMINELAANAFESLGLSRAAEAHLKNARYLYYRWGAVRKVEMLDAAHPFLRQDLAGKPDGAEDAERPDPGDGQEGVTLDSLDLASVMKAARAISSELVLTNLWSRTMQIVLESAGAQRGVFVTRDGGRLLIEVEGAVEDGKAQLQEDGASRDCEDAAPLSIITYALRTRSPVVLDDASASAQFGADPYVVRRKTKSVICVPIVRSEQFEGAIYLENDLAEGVFSQGRVDIVELLAAQASISMENAHLYVDLERKVEERTSELSHKTRALETVANQLSKYLSPQVYQSIFDRKRDVKLTSERKRLTVFFSDLVGFTETADRLESEELTLLLNQYLTEMSNIALAHGATIDKFVGDAIVIFFGDPETRGVGQDATACARMAVAMRERLEDMRVQWTDQGIERPFECRMGIHTGYCAVGNFGSEARMDYTIIGGAVNLASRLENAAKPNQILISNDTYALIKNDIYCQERGNLSVRGISHPVATYEVVDLVENLAESLRPIREESPNLRLNIDFANMSADERREAAGRLRQAAELLDGTPRKTGVARETRDPVTRTTSKP